MQILYINSLRPSVKELGFHADRARLVPFSEFSFKRSVISGPKFPVPRIFFQKICGFRARRTSRPGRCTVCRGPKTQVTFKTIPLVPRAQKLFRTSITHFYFFTHRAPSLESRPIQVPSPNAQASKTRTIKKNLAQAGRRPGVWNRRSKY